MTNVNLSVRWHDCDQWEQMWNKKNILHDALHLVVRYLQYYDNDPLSISLPKAGYGPHPISIYSTCSFGISLCTIIINVISFPFPVRHRKHRFSWTGEGRCDEISQSGEEGQLSFFPSRRKKEGSFRWKDTQKWIIQYGGDIAMNIHKFMWLLLINDRWEGRGEGTDGERDQSGYFLIKLWGLAD